MTPLLVTVPVSSCRSSLITRGTYHTALTTQAPAIRIPPIRCGQVLGLRIQYGRTGCSVRLPVCCVSVRRPAVLGETDWVPGDSRESGRDVCGDGGDG